MKLTGRAFTVVGAGVAGLTVATALARAGATVRLCEQADEIAEVGAGIQITPNGSAVLAALGLGEALAAQAIRAEAVELRDYRAGTRVLRLDLNRRRHANPHPYLFIHRADLIDLLGAAAREAGVEIELGKVVTAPEGGTIGDARGASELLIGADGLHSRVRAALNGDGVPFFTGQVAWRTLVALEPGERPAPTAQVWMGPRRHLVTYPVRGGRLLNVVAVEERRSWVAEGWSHRDDPETMCESFAGFAPEVRRLIERAQEVFVWGLFRHEVARRWHGDAMVILGDAAHPTLPFLAQGANMAIEDAWVLAQALQSAERLAEALDAYQAARAPRTRRIVAAAGRNARAYHLSNPLVRLGAHSALRLGGALLPAAALGRFDWLYGEDVTRA